MDDSLWTRKALPHMACAAQDVGRFSDALVVVNTLVEKAKIGSPLTQEEVEFVSATCQTVLSEKHNAWRTISRKVEEEEQHSGKSARSVALEVYRDEVLVQDMDTACSEVLHIFQHHLLPSCSGGKNVDLYKKMLGTIDWILTLWPNIEDKELHAENTFAADEGAIVLERQALHDAGPELALLHEESASKKSAESMGLMEEKLKLVDATSPSSKDYSEPSLENNITSKLASFLLEEEPSHTEGSPSYSGGSLSSPPPVVPLPAGSAVAPNEFISPGDWGYEVQEGLTRREILYRKMVAKKNRGFMG